MRLYDFMDSGNGYKVRLLLHQLGQSFELIEKDIDKGETRTPDFLRINPNGRIPVLEISQGQHLAESNAIMFHLAQGTSYFPQATYEQSRVMQWLFFEQYSHEPNIATPRYWIRHGLMTKEREPLLAQKLEQGYAALQVMEQSLARTPFLVESQYTIADIALYAYTHVAADGGFDLSGFPGFPAILAWLDRVRIQSGHVPMTWRPSAR